MRIAFVVPSISRVAAGVSEIARLTVEAVAEVPGFEVEVAALIDDHYEADLPAWKDFPVHAFPITGPSNYGYSPGLGKHLLNRKVDLMHVHGLWMYHCLATHRWAKRTGRPYVVTPHGMLEPWIMSRSPKKKALVSRLYQNEFLARAGAIHVGSAKEAADVKSIVGDLPMVDIPNYVDLADPANGDIKPQWYKPEYDGKDIFLFLSRIHEKKGCEELLQAWDAVCTASPEFKAKSVMVFCGPLDGIENFEGKVEEVAGRHFNVIYAGPQHGAEKKRSLAAADFFVLPSKSEGLPIAVLEAWGAGLIVVMTPECNLRVGFEAGAAVEIGRTPTEIKPGLLAASGLSAEQRAQKVAAGQGLIETRFSRRVVAESFTRIFRSLVENGRI